MVLLIRNQQRMIFLATLPVIMDLSLNFHTFQVPFEMNTNAFVKKPYKYLKDAVWSWKE